MSIRKEIESATGLTKGNEPEKLFLVKLARAAEKLPEEAWDALSAEAQDWVNDACKEIIEAKKAGRDPDITGFGVEKAEEPEAEAEADDGDEAEEEADEPEAEEADEPKPTKKKKAKEPKAPKKPKADKAPKAEKKGRSGVSMTVRKICLAHPDWKEARVYEKAKQSHPDLLQNTLRGVYQSVMGVIKAANALGYEIVKK